VTIATSAPVLLGVSGVTKIFGDQVALDNVGLSIHAGRIHGLAGHNGSGKSTLIKILADFHHPEAGARIQLGADVHEWNDAPNGWRDRLRFVHQDLGLVPTLDAVENFAVGSHYLRTSTGRIDWRSQIRRTRTALARLDVEVDVRLPVSRLSAVNRTMVAIARAFDDLPDRGVLILDEPTAALSQPDADMLFQLVRRMVGHGAGVLFVTHHLDELVELSDQVTVLRDGRVTHSAGRSDVSRSVIATAIAGVPERRQAPRRPAPASVGSPRVQVTGLSGGNLREFSLDVAPGEIVGIAGLAGSGRDDLAPLLTGARRVLAGTVAVDGARVDLRNPRTAMRAGICHVPADRHAQALFPNHPVSENVTLPWLGEFAAVFGINRPAERRAATRSLADADVRPLMPERLVTQFSGGNQQKAVLARFLRSRPKMLVLDEHTQGVDVGARASVRELLVTAAAQGTCMVVCSSDNEELASLCDRVLVLIRGRLVDTLRGEQLTTGHVTHACLGQDSDHGMVTTNG
jgi:ribose transport system ATP-binding protein